MSIVGHIVDTATVDIANQTEQPISTQVLVQPQLADFPDDILFMPVKTELTSRFYYIERLRSVNSEPVFFEKLTLPNQHLPGLADLNFENRSLFETLRTVYNIVVQGAEQKLLATTATENLAQLLDVP